MATFEAKVYRLKIEPHPNADKLELAAVGDFRTVVGKDLYKTGQLGVYVPEGALVPKWLCEKYDWKLAGPDANRVKAIKLRGIVSQGIIVPIRDGSIVDPDWIYPDGCDGHLELEDGTETDIQIGEDVAGLLGITKYEPPIPTHMAGEVWNAFGYTLNYDIENIKKHPDIFREDEMVLITEKLHGTWTCFGHHPGVEFPIITSKGLSGRGLAFKINDANKDNLYVRSLMNSIDKDGRNVLDRLMGEFTGGLPFYILGETYGKGVQDLTYGLTKPHFRAFDIYVGAPGEGRYLSGTEFTSVCNKAGIETVPVMYRGPFSKEKVQELTNGKDTISGTNIREGVVIRPLVDERRDDTIGRVILKSVSDAYLLRKGEVTEFN